MSRGIRLSVIMAAADADGISTSQTPAGAGDLTITGALATGGIAYLGAMRQVLVTTVSNESGKTMTIYGTDLTGNVISETMTGPNATTGSPVQHFYTVTRIAVSAAFTGAVTVGTSGVGSTPWVPLDTNRVGGNWSLATILGSGVTANVMPQGTLDCLSPGEVGRWMLQPTDTFPTPAAFDLAAAAQTANGLVHGDYPLHGVRLLINSGAATPGVFFEIVQQGLQ